jgi:glutamate-5-semialdehyde dehydrogenase
VVTEDILRAPAAARDAAPPPGDERYAAYCVELARRLEKNWDTVLAANAEDLAKARAQGLGEVLIDRLALADRHLADLVALTERTRLALPEVTRRPEPVTATGGMVVRRIPKAIGVLFMIYEARPTVTVEAALLPVAVGNVAVLRGGSEIAATNAALGAVAADAVMAAGLPEGMVHVITDADRRTVRELLKRHDVIDALIPRGSPSLIDYCRTASTIPVIASGGGVNHMYVDRSADLELAAKIALDSKLTEPTACNTLEMVLAHEDIAAPLTEALARLGKDFTLRVDPRLAVDGLAVLSEHDDGREFLDRSIGVRPVSGVAQAVEHIRTYGSRHTEGIIATDDPVIESFLNSVDAAALVVNGSMRLHDGPTMSLGPELSISTGRLHVRGPVNLSALLTYAWVIEGNNTIRGEESA